MIIIILRIVIIIIIAMIINVICSSKYIENEEKKAMAVFWSVFANVVMGVNVAPSAGHNWTLKRLFTVVPPLVKRPPLEGAPTV